jgi:DNA primase
VHRGGRGASFCYELVYDGGGADGALFVPGLIDVERLRMATTGTSRGLEPSFAGVVRPPRGPDAGGPRVLESQPSPRTQSVSGESLDESAKTHLLQGNGKHPSYAPVVAAAR